MSDLVIGEGVALDLRLAKLPSRALARLLDALVQGAGGLLLLALVVQLGLSGVDDAVRVGVAIVLTVLVLVGYPVVLESLTGGRTLGKIALGLRVVRTDGGPLRFRHALVRGLTGVFDFFISFGVLAAVTSFCSRDGRRTGDFLAGTVVVRYRVPDSGTTPLGLAALSMPYPLLGWAQTLELSTVPDELALVVRQFLTRMYELRPEVAARMAYDLATEVSQYVQLPPQGTPPWAYLAAVTAERRARQIRRAEAERRALWEQQMQAARQAQQAFAAQQAAQWAQAEVPAPRYAALQDVAAAHQPASPATNAATPVQAPAPVAPTPPDSTDGDGFAPPQ